MSYLSVGLQSLMKSFLFKALIAGLSQPPTDLQISHRPLLTKTGIAYATSAKI